MVCVVECVRSSHTAQSLCCVHCAVSWAECTLVLAVSPTKTRQGWAGGVTWCVWSVGMCVGKYLQEVAVSGYTASVVGWVVWKQVLMVFDT